MVQGRGYTCFSMRSTAGRWRRRIGAITTANRSGTASGARSAFIGARGAAPPPAPAAPPGRPRSRALAGPRSDRSEALLASSHLPGGRAALAALGHGTLDPVRLGVGTPQVDGPDLVGGDELLPQGLGVGQLHERRGR